MNVSLDSMVTIVTSRVQQTVILHSVIRSQVTVAVAVVMVFMVTSVHKSALRIVRTFVIENKAPVTHAKWVIMETNA